MNLRTDYILTEKLCKELALVNLQNIRIDNTYLLSVVEGQTKPTKDQLKGILLELARIGNKDYFELEQIFKLWL